MKSINYDLLHSKLQADNRWKGLTGCQKTFFELFCSGSNILLTGQAGTGKSFCLNYLFSILDKNEIPYGKTATTGIAALNIGGSTIHSFCGIGLGNEDIEELFKRVFRNKKATSRIRVAQILCIDEISMCSGELLEKIDKVLKGVRKNKAPFGGLQVIGCGDFLQLPPVFKNEDNPMFVFETKTWQQAAFATVELKEIVRQEHNSEFAKLLNKIRIGDLDSIELLSDRINKKVDSGNVRPIKLFCRNMSVDKYNEACLNSLTTPAKTFKSADMGEQHHIDYFNKNCLAPQALVLKVGAQVMLVRNVDTENGLVNGSLGIVKAFQDNLPVVEFSNKIKHTVERESWEIKEQVVVTGLDNIEKIKYKVVAKRSQIPLKLAYASTIHKVQGQTLSCADIDISDAFETGQVYVALSRVKDINSLTLKPFNLGKIKVNQKCLDFYNNK